MKSLVDAQIEDIAQSNEISIDEATQQFLKNSQHVTNFDELPKQNHIWIDRGAKYSCENAGHAWHEAWKRRKATV